VRVMQQGQVGQHWMNQWVSAQTDAIEVDESMGFQWALSEGTP
jgi:hypothetical protein